VRSGVDVAVVTGSSSPRFVVFGAVDRGPLSSTLVPGPGPRDGSSLTVVPVRVAPPVAGTRPSMELSGACVGAADATVRSSEDDSLTLDSVDNDTACATVPVLATGVESASVVSSGLTPFCQTPVNGPVWLEPPSVGNKVSCTDNAAAVPPTAVTQYSNQPTSALVRRRGARLIAVGAPRNTSLTDTRSEARTAEALIIGRSLSPPP